MIALNSDAFLFTLPFSMHRQFNQPFEEKSRYYRKFPTDCVVFEIIKIIRALLCFVAYTYDQHTCHCLK